MCQHCKGRHTLRDSLGRFRSHLAPFVNALTRMRNDWRAYLESVVTSAEEFTRGHLLTADGWMRGASVLRIITGQSRGKYASAELREYLRTRPVLTFDEYVAQVAQH